MSQALYEDGLLDGIAFLDLSGPRSRTNSFNSEGSFQTIETDDEAAVSVDAAVDAAVAAAVVDLMPSPPAGEFRSIDELEKHIHDHARTYGYALSVARTDKRWGLKYTFGCTQRRGQSPVRENNTRKAQGKRPKRKSKRVRCKMSVIAKRRTDGSWELSNGGCTEHNHEPAASSVFASHRRRQLEDPQCLREIEIDYHVGALPRVTLARLRHLGFNLLLTSDIYNEQQRIRQVDLGGKTAIERAVEVVKETDKY